MSADEILRQKKKREAAAAYQALSGKAPLPAASNKLAVPGFPAAKRQAVSAAGLLGNTGLPARPVGFTAAAAPRPIVAGPAPLTRLAGFSVSLPLQNQHGNGAPASGAPRVPHATAAPAPGGGAATANPAQHGASAASDVDTAGDSAAVSNGGSGSGSGSARPQGGLLAAHQLAKANSSSTSITGNGGALAAPSVSGQPHPQQQQRVSGAGEGQSDARAALEDRSAQSYSFLAGYFGMFVCGCVARVWRGNCMCEVVNHHPLNCLN
jgi:hypothetical protein